MRRVCWAAWLVSVAAAFALGFMAPLRAGAQAPVPVGAEFQVNTYTTSHQVGPAVATVANGGFVVVWFSNGSSGTDTSYSSIQGQRYASDGSKQGAQFQVNTFTTGYQLRPSVAADTGGDFVVVWESDGSSGIGTGPRSIQGQRYASNGSPQGAQFQVNSYTTSSQSEASVTADSDGDFVVVWTSAGSSGTDTSASSVHGQRYTSNGATQGGKFQVNTYTTSFQSGPSVAAGADGDFVVVWQSTGSFGTDTSPQSIQGQRYASNGSPQGGEFQVNTYTTSFQRSPSVAVDSDGDFVVVWDSNGSSGTDTGDPFTAWGTSVEGQRYASDGSTQGAQFQVNTYTTLGQYSPSVAVDADGGFVVVWNSAGSFATDTSSYSIQGQRYSVTAPAPPVPAMSPATRFALAAALLLFGATYGLRRRS